MNRKKISLVIERFFKTLEQSGKEATKDFDIERIHQFRVSYKKLRAFFRLLSTDVNSKQKLKMPSKIKAAYLAAGKVRDLQLHHQRLRLVSRENTKRNPVYTLYTSEEKRANYSFTKKYCKIDFSSANKRIQFLIPGHFDPASFGRFVNHKWEVVSKLMSAAHLSDANVHSIRKNLKDLFYNVAILKGSKYNTFRKLACKNKSLGYFKKLLKELGNFQDACASLDLMKKYKKQLSVESLNLLKAKKRKVKNAIVHNLKNFISDLQH